jgi:hypothetical protein
MQKEATARIKINKLLEQAGWKLLDDDRGPDCTRTRREEGK